MLDASRWCLLAATDGRPAAERRGCGGCIYVAKACLFNFN
jgi:hypothetical protein